MNKAKKYIEKNRGFLEFLKSLYKPVKLLTIIMIASMIISQALDLVKQYIIKGIIDLPNTNGFQTTDLYRVIFILHPKSIFYYTFLLLYHYCIIMLKIFLYLYIKVFHI